MQLTVTGTFHKTRKRRLARYSTPTQILMFYPGLSMFPMFLLRVVSRIPGFQCWTGRKPRGNTRGKRIEICICVYLALSQAKSEISINPPLPSSSSFNGYWPFGLPVQDRIHHRSKSLNFRIPLIQPRELNF